MASTKLVRGTLVVLALILILFSFVFTPANAWGVFIPKTNNTIDKVDLQYIFIYFVPFALAVFTHVLFSPDTSNGAATALSTTSSKRSSIDVPKWKVTNARWTWTMREIFLSITLVLCNIIWISMPVIARYAPANPVAKVDKSLRSVVMGIGRKAGAAGMWNAALAIVFVVRENHLLKAVLGQEAGSYHNVIRFHVAAGYTCLGWLTFHGVSYMIKWTVDGDLEHELYPTVSKAGYANFMGLLGWICLWIMALFSVFKVRRKNYRLFYFTHQLYIAFLVLGFIHYFGTFYPMIAPLLYFLWDRIQPRLNIKRSVEVRVTKTGEGVLHVEIPLFPGFRNTAAYAPGDWINIQIPEISKLQWHPFTPSSYYPESPNTVSLMVAVRGSWTQKLSEAAEKSETGLFKANIDGLFGSRSTTYLSHDTLVLVGGGTGIAALTPFLKHYTRVRTTGLVHFIWIAKNSESVAAHASLVSELKSAGSNVNLHLYLTREFNIDVGPVQQDEKNEKSLLDVVQVHKRSMSQASQQPSLTPVSSNRNASRFTAFLLALSIFGTGIALYCVGRIFMQPYSTKTCSPPNLYKTFGYDHFICFYYYYLAQVVYCIFGAAVAGMAVAIGSTMHKTPERLWNPRPTEQERNAVVATVKGMPFKVGRPNFKELLEQIEEENSVVGVIGAGPEGILKAVKENIVGNPKFSFYRESWKV